MLCKAVMRRSEGRHEELVTNNWQVPQAVAKSICFEPISRVPQVESSLEAIRWVDRIQEIEVMDFPKFICCLEDGVYGQSQRFSVDTNIGCANFNEFLIQRSHN